MRGGFRGIVVALVGLALIGASAAPDADGASGKRQSDASVEQAKPPIAAVATETSTPIVPPEYYQPCDQPRSHNRSDLCAQWKAANAASTAAWLSGASFLAVLLALYLAFQSNRIARDTARRQLRAYVGYSNDWYHSEFTIGQELLLKPKIVNDGETPARKVLWQAQLQTIHDANAEDAFALDPLPPGSTSTLGRGQWTQTTLRVTPTAESYAMIMSGARELYVFGSISYEDVFGEEWTTAFRLRLIPEEQRWVMCSDGNEGT